MMWAGIDERPVMFFFDAVHGAQTAKGDKAAAVQGLKKKLRESGRLSG
jgi:hypothetical protein